jgi:hypothetical protein
MHPSQGSKASRLRPLRQWTEEMPDLRDIHLVGWTLVPVLRLSSADKAEEPEVQGEAQGSDKETTNGPAAGIVYASIEDDNTSRDKAQT